MAEAVVNGIFNVSKWLLTSKGGLAVTSIGGLGVASYMSGANEANAAGAPAAPDPAITARIAELVQYHIEKSSLDDDKDPEKIRTALTQLLSLYAQTVPNAFNQDGDNAPSKDPLFMIQAVSLLGDSNHFDTSTNQFKEGSVTTALIPIVRSQVPSSPPGVPPTSGSGTTPSTQSVAQQIGTGLGNIVGGAVNVVDSAIEATGVRDAASSGIESTAGAMESASQWAHEMGQTIGDPNAPGSSGPEQIIGAAGNFLSGAGALAAGTVSRLWGTAANPNREGREWLAYGGLFGAGLFIASYVNQQSSKMGILGSLPLGLIAFAIVMMAGHSGLKGAKAGSSATPTDGFNDAANGASQAPAVTTTFTLDDGTTINLNDQDKDNYFAIQRGGNLKGGSYQSWADFSVLAPEAVTTANLNKPDNVIYVPASRWGSAGRPRFESTALDVQPHDAAKDPDYNQRPVYLKATGTDGPIIIMDNDNDRNNNAATPAAPST